MQDFLFYLQLGWEHIISLDALDHQLFLLVLMAVYNYQDLKKILILITAFTLGHSATLVLSSLEIVQIPSKWIEFLIPVTIFLTALDNILFSKKQNRLIRTNYFLALFFGLIHGLGFANTVKIMLAEEQNILFPLLGFNIGVEMGQIFLAAIFLLIFYLFTKIFKVSKRDWILFISSGVFALALKMTLERIP